MFTGIVEEIGVVAALNPQDATGGTSLTVELPAGSDLLSDARLGDSMAVNGCCLTLTAIQRPGESGQSGQSGQAEQPEQKKNTAPPPPPSSFTVGIAPETLRLTNLGALAAGSRVNLERAVRADTRMGGHFVQGHVDTVADIVEMRADGNAISIRLAPRAREVLRYVVFKGFIALDGTSLTVTRVDDGQGWWEVMLIAYTQERVVIAGKTVGDSVNVEVDMTAKYVEKSVAAYLTSLEQGGGEGGGGGGGGGGTPLLQKVVQNIVAQGFSGNG